MNNNISDDTIAAISTPIGEGGIAIVRISGQDAIVIADQIFHSPKGPVSSFQSHTIHYGTIGINGDLLDQVMLSVMKSPHTYTMENTVEINCHGGLFIAREVLARCVQHGARLAEPGEFTKRAFLNGRIDLIQAEGVTDLIRAKTDRAHFAALKSLDGHLSAKINEIRDLLITVTAHVEAHLDFPEEDIEADKSEHLLAIIIDISKKLKILSDTEREGKILREGISIAIVGRPNVGKSSLMNAFLGQQRSIVTSVPGTTRDTIEELANIRGVPVRFTDTAGIRSARGSVEKIGIERSHKAMKLSDITLVVLDRSKSLSSIDKSIIQRASDKTSILVLNKNDLPKKLIIPENISNKIALEISTLTEDGVNTLKDKIIELAISKTSGINCEVTINERHADAIRRALKHLSSATAEFNHKRSLEILSQDLRSALDSLGEIVGKTTDEDILDKIFSTFCIGK